MSGSLSYKICVVEKSSAKGVSVLNKLGNLFVIPGKGAKYLYLDQSLMQAWLARGLKISPSFTLFLRYFKSL